MTLLLKYCAGYHSLLAAIERDEQRDTRPHRRSHNYRAKLSFAIERAKHYAEKTGLSAESILDAWEGKRNYWYMNFYQDCNQPEIKGDSVRVFDTVQALLDSIGKSGFRCPACGGVSKSPYECDSGIEREGKPCDWKSYGLFGTLGKGINIFVKERIAGQNIFMPVAWEKAAAA